MGYILEGQSNLEKAEEQYLNYLQENPRNKFAALRLCHLYERMGFPDKAAQILKQLHEVRPKDWKLAKEYLEVLDDTGNENLYYKEALQIANSFMELPRFTKAPIEELYQKILDLALWKGKYQDAIFIYQKLISLSDDPDFYELELTELYKGLKKTNKVISLLKNQMKNNPNNIPVINELASIYISLSDYKNAILYLNKGLKIDPLAINIRKNRAYVLLETKNYKSAENDLKLLIANQALSKNEKINFQNDLAEIYILQKKIKKAFLVFYNMIQEDPNNKAAWKSIIGLQIDQKLTDEAIKTLHSFLVRFPNDQEVKKDLVGLYLYEKKSFKKMRLYKNFVVETGDADFALDVAYLLLEKEKTHRLYKNWLLFLYNKFPNHSGVGELIYDYYLERKEFKNALNVALKFYKKNPKNPNWILKAASSYVLCSQNREAEDLFVKLSKLSPSDYQTQKIVATELFFMGRYHEALSHFQKALLLNQSDPELWYWLSEYYSANGNYKKMMEVTHKSLSLFESDRPKSFLQKRIQLKMESRVDWSADVEKKYDSFLKQHIKELGIWEDYLDTVLTHKDKKKVKELINRFESYHKEKKYLLLPYKVRLAYLEKKWDKAVELLDEMTTKYPDQWGYKRDLAYSLWQNRKFKQSAKIYDTVYKHTQNQLNVEDSLDEIHKIVDDRVLSSFYLLNFASETHWELRNQYHHFFGDSMEINVGVGSKWLKSGSILEKITYGDLDFTSYHLKDLDLSLGIKSYIQPEARVSPHFSVKKIFKEQSFVKVSGSYKSVRNDLLQAVQNRTYIDKASLHGETVLNRKYIVNSDYEFSKSYLNNGSYSLGHTLEQSIHYILKERPYLTIGLQGNYWHQSNHDNFLNQVGLIPESLSSFLVFYLEYPVGEELDLEFSGYWGEDFVRNLHFYQFDILGVSTNVKWKATSWLDFICNYSYSRESLATITGQSHSIRVELSGHWF